MDALEKDRQQRIDSLRERIEQLLKDKPNFETQREQWNVWANEYFPLCKKIKYYRLHPPTRIIGGKIIKAPLLLIGCSLIVRWVDGHQEWELVGFHERELTSYEEKIFQCFLKYIGKLDDAWHGFVYSIELLRYEKMGDWDYASVDMPYEIQVKPDGFHLTKYTIMGKNKKGYITVNCDYILDGRKIVRG